MEILTTREHDISNGVTKQGRAVQILKSEIEKDQLLRNASVSTHWGQLAMVVLTEKIQSSLDF